MESEGRWLDGCKRAASPRGKGSSRWSWRPLLHAAHQRRPPPLPVPSRCAPAWLPPAACRRIWRGSCRVWARIIPACRRRTFPAMRRRLRVSCRRKRVLQVLPSSPSNSDPASSPGTTGPAVRAMVERSTPPFRLLSAALPPREWRRSTRRRHRAWKKSPIPPPAAARRPQRRHAGRS